MIRKWLTVNEWDSRGRNRETWTLLYCPLSFQTFGKVAVDENTHINRNCNFQTFFMAVLLLFRWVDKTLICA